MLGWPTSSTPQNEKANRGVQRRRQKEPINKGGEHQGLQAESAARKQRSNENKSKAGIKPQRWKDGRQEATKNFWAGKNFWPFFTILISNIKYRLIIKLITQMDGKSWDKSIEPINPSLVVVYYSTTLSNHCISRFIRFISRFCPRVMEWVLSVIHI